MEVASDIGAWGRCHPRPSIFEGTFQIPAKKIDKSTSTINKFDLGHKNHKKNSIFVPTKFVDKFAKKIDRSTDSFGFLGDRFEICRHVDKFQIC